MQFYDKWSDEFYQNIEYIEHKLSYGPLINVYSLTDKLFTCKLLDLYKNIIKYINNDTDIKIMIIINDQIIVCTYINTSIHMLEQYINSNTLELNITIIKQEILDNELEYTYKFRKNSITKFYSKLLDWKNTMLKNILWNKYNIIYDDILYYIDFNDLFLKNNEDDEMNILYNNYYSFEFDSDSELDYDLDIDYNFDYD